LLSARRTSSAALAAKKRGQRLGNPAIIEAAKLGRAALKSNARRFAANVEPIIDVIPLHLTADPVEMAAGRSPLHADSAVISMGRMRLLADLLHRFDGAHAGRSALVVMSANEPHQRVARGSELTRA
jgi:hypothetical protein